MAPHSTFPPPPSTSSTSPPGLTPSQLAFWDNNGYLIIEDALDKETVTTLLAETHKMLNDFSLDDHPMTKFSTGEGDGQEHVGDEYFLSSGDKVRFFFEEGMSLLRVLYAISPTGHLLKPKHLSINKIGHGLHLHSPSFRRATLSPSNIAIARSLSLRDPNVLQSMIICKQPEIGGRVPPHQDSTFLYTDPPSAVGFWYALEDATRENGCLSFAGGSHRRAAVKQRFVRRREKGGTVFEDVVGGRFPVGLEVEDVGDGVGGEEEYTIGEVKAGSLVLIHGNLLHKSERNVSAKGRIIYTFHMIERGAKYDERNWLSKPEGGFTRLYEGFTT